MKRYFSSIWSLVIGHLCIVPDGKEDSPTSSQKKESKVPLFASMKMIKIQLSRLNCFLRRGHFAEIFELEFMALKTLQIGPCSTRAFNQTFSRLYPLVTFAKDSRPFEIMV